MNYTDINRCMIVLHEKSQNIDNKLQCFDTIQKIGTPGTICSIFGFLASNNPRIQAKAAETILLLFGKLKSLNEYVDSLKHLAIEISYLEFYRAHYDEKTFVQLLAIASLNMNGYVREKAVQELSGIKDANTFKFLLLRAGDWVEEVRRSATEAIYSFLETTYLEDLLKHLPTIDWLLKVQRVDLTEIHGRIINFILSQDFSEAFYNKLIRLDGKVRFRFYKAFLANKIATKEQITKISTDKNFLVRLEVLRRVVDFDIDIQKQIVTAFLHDSSPRVRIEALYASKRFSGQFDEQIVQLLSDQSAWVRQLSRHLLKDKISDFTVLYRRRVSERLYLSGSLPGLSETGNIEDLPVFEQYINADKSKLIIASLAAINKFNETKAKHYSLQLLVHPFKEVRDKALDILAKNTDVATLQKVREIYAQGSFDIKNSILKLYNKIGGWNIIGDLLLAIADENETIQHSGWQLLVKWRLNVTRLFTTPPMIEIERANKIYNSLDMNHLKMTPARLALLQEVKFILR